MKTEPITELFEGGGVLVTPEAGETLNVLPYEQVMNLFERHGLVAFRGFELEPDQLTSVTDRFTESYSMDALRRATRFGQKSVHDVDYGPFALPLHSEASFAPAWPELLWFFCVVPPTAGGETTLCDGLKLWQSLSDDVRSLFLAEPLRYDLEIPLPETRPGGGREPWVSNAPGISGVIDWDAGMLFITQLRSAVHEARLPNRLCFINHLPSAAVEPQVKRVTMVSGREIPAEVMEEVLAKSDLLTYAHKWQQRDLVMVDNHRFFHGRRAYDEHVKRDIVNVQTARASFAYGASLRRQIRRPQSSASVPHVNPPGLQGAAR